MIFDIKQWNVFSLDNNSNNRKPSVYITPTAELLTNLKANPDQLFNVRITGTDTMYDDTIMTAGALSSVNTPSYRPVFYMKNGYLIIVLGSLWLGYTCKMGQIEIMI